jgi:hypothetical protein
MDVSFDLIYRVISQFALLSMAEGAKPGGRIRKIS